MEPICRVTWGLAGVAETARLLPESTPEFVEFLQEHGILVEVPTYTPNQLAFSKDPTWILPTIQIFQDLSIGIITGLIVDYLHDKFKKSSDRRVRVTISRTRTLDGTDSTEWQIEGAAADVAQQLKTLE